MKKSRRWGWEGHEALETLLGELRSEQANGLLTFTGGPSTLAP